MRPYEGEMCFYPQNFLNSMPSGEYPAVGVKAKA